MIRIALLTVLFALVFPPSTPAAAADGHDGVWDAYGGASCREGVFNMETFVIRQGKVTGKLDTTDNADDIKGTVNRFGKLTAYVNGTYTLIRIHGVMTDTEGYGPVTAEGDDVDCSGAWNARKRAEPNTPHVHLVKQPDGSVMPAPLPAGHRSRSQTWNGQLEFERKYKTLSKTADEFRIRTIMNK